MYGYELDAKLKLTLHLNTILDPANIFLKVYLKKQSAVKLIVKNVLKSE